jgi:acetyl-CoA carboxylase biotin carboxyl carrier protein
VAGDRRSPLERQPNDRLGDHAAIDRLTDELLPALVAKLGASGLGELEVREGSWRVRLRMPADGRAAIGRRSLPGRGGPRLPEGPRGEHGHPDTPTAGHRGAGPGRPLEATAGVGPTRVVATAPAVGYFRPQANLPAGTRVRAGDRIGGVDVLGIGQDIVAPADGLIGATLVDAGEPVEYGQAIIVLDQLAPHRPQAEPAAAAADAAPARATGERVDGGQGGEAGHGRDGGPGGQADPDRDGAPTGGAGQGDDGPAGDVDPAAEGGAPPPVVA